MFEKRKWKKIVAFILLVCSLGMPNTVLGADLDKPVTEVIENEITCSRACGGMCYFVCRHDWLYNYDNSYTHNFGNCSVRVYSCSYTGMKCEFCGYVQTMSSLNMTAFHLCHEVHSSCGKGTVSRCSEYKYM